MSADSLEEALRDTLHQEVARERPRLDGLEKCVTTELAGRLPRLRPSEALRRLLAPTRGARIGQLAVVTATAALFLLVGVFLAGKVSPWREPGLRLTTAGAGDAQGAAGILFVMPAPGAKSVAVVGTWNGWQAAPLSDSDGDGIWTATIPLPPGRHEYAFVIDGRWWGQDPLADEVVRSFGEDNSVRYVGRAGDGA